MPSDFESESWERDGPSYVPTYVLSAFVLLGLLGIAANGLPVSTLSVLFFAIWFGLALLWIWQNHRAERTFSSDRIVVREGKVTHSFRYTITEAVHQEVDVEDIQEIAIHSGDPIGIELIGQHDSDFFFFPSRDKAEQFTQTLSELNPKLRVRY